VGDAVKHRTWIRTKGAYRCAVVVSDQGANDMNNNALAITNLLLFVIALILLAKFFPGYLSTAVTWALIAGIVIAAFWVVRAIIRYFGRRALMAQLAPLIEKRQRLWKEGEYEFAEKYPTLPQPMASIAMCSQFEEWHKVSSEKSRINALSSFRIEPFP
jgi:hypothetical protein